MPFYVAGAIEVTAGALFLTLLIPSRKQQSEEQVPCQQDGDRQVSDPLNTQLQRRLHPDTASALSSTLSLSML